MEVTGALLTVTEFARLSQPKGGVRQELHNGELIELLPVKKLHTKLQKRLVSLIEALLNDAECGVDKEFPFRPAAEHEVWVADVAIFNLATWEQTADDDYFGCVPAVVIEVLSPSKTASEVLALEEICLRNGGQEFWIVDPQRETVKVIRAGGLAHAYHAGDAIESSLLHVPVKVDDIFAV